jgi:hypothetical protein
MSREPATCLVIFLGLAIIFGAVMFFCPSCSQNVVDANGAREAKTEWWKEHYGGHVYVVRGGGLQGYGSGIAHDPDCPCQVKKRVEQRTGRPAS